MSNIDPRCNNCKGYHEDHYHYVISTFIDTSLDMVSYDIMTQAKLQDTAMSYSA